MNKSKTYLISAGLAFTVSACSVILTMLDMQAIVCGLCFWGGLLAGAVLYSLSVKALPEKKEEAGKIVRRMSAFFSNKAAGIMDVILVVSLVLTILFYVRYGSSQTAAAYILFVFVWSVYGHFLFNGRVFNDLIKEKQRIKKGE